jgi:hypothetical protein
MTDLLSTYSFIFVFTYGGGYIFTIRIYAYMRLFDNIKKEKVSAS